jgi:hypothetical protein
MGVVGVQLEGHQAGTADEAFAALERSQRENVKLREIARRILEELPQRFTGDPFP